MKRILKWAGAGLAISILVGGLAWAVRAGKEGSKLDREMATIRAGRYATSRAELEGPAPSDSENAAPHYEAALAKIVEYKGVDVPDALKRGLKALSPEARANVLGWLARNAEAIEGLHRAASFPRCRYSPDRAVKYWRGVELLRMKAQADLDAGRTTAAAETLRDLVALGESFRESPSLL
ncbi:MAG: hypothetical protein HYY17_10495, partial [Planctomycetes bacterium]|nr:hypothetical protein [Planctomycetota bacterium]